MLVRSLHCWDVGIKEAIGIQEHLRGQVILRGSVRSLRWVVGCDVAYERIGAGLVGGAVLWDARENQVAEAHLVRGASRFPYVPGFLSFREIPVLLEVLSRIQGRVQVVLVDGQGVTHPRGMGIATHLGLHLDVPTVGCAKSSLVGSWELPGLQKGDRTWITYDGVRVGAVLRTRERVRPVFVSPGNRISLEGAIKVVMQCVRGKRIPEPLREAHIRVERVKRADERAAFGHN